MSHLVFLIHGFGVDSKAWWGTTIQALDGDTELSQDGFKVDAWGYKASSRPQTKLAKLQATLRGDGRLQSIQEIGESLWTDLLIKQKKEHYESVRLFGHSMGGLVAAAALYHGFTRQSEEDRELAAHIRSVALCASPIGGAKFVRRIRALYRFLGENVHINDLGPKSPARKKIVVGFVQKVIEGSQLSITILRAGQDNVVRPKETTGPIPEHLINGRCTVRTLDGDHSRCVRDLNGSSKNFSIIKDWIRDPPQPYGPTNAFDRMMKEIQKECSVAHGVLHEFATNRDTSTVKAEYIARTLLQKVVHASTLLHSTATSANLWSCYQTDEQGRPRRLVSMEREGYFSVDQLVGDVTGGGVQHRSPKVLYPDAIADDEDLKSLMVAAKCFSEQRIVHEKIAPGIGETLEADTLQQKTMTLGIPRSSNNHALSPLRPVSITVDFSVNPPLCDGEIEVLLERAKQLREVFIKLADAIDLHLPESFATHQETPAQPAQE